MQHLLLQRHYLGCQALHITDLINTGKPIIGALALNPVCVVPLQGEKKESTEKGKQILRH